MNTATKATTTQPLDRRRLLRLAAAAVLVVAGCTRARQDSDLDESISELNQLLDNMGDDEQQRVSAIVQRIQGRVRKLADEHRTFTESFDRMLITYETTESQLQQLIDTYNRRRMGMRNDLLHLQNKLHASMTPDDWAEVVRVLNRAGKSLAGYTLSGS